MTKATGILAPLNVSVTPDDTLEGYPDAYTYRLDGNDGIVTVSYTHLLSR